MATKVGVSEAAAQLELQTSQLYTWRSKAEAANRRGQVDRAMAAENVRLKRLFAEKEQEIAILKKVSAIIAKLQKNALGEVRPPMSASEVKSALGLLAKIMPDQTRVETEEVEPPPSVEESKTQLVEMLKADPAMWKEIQRRMNEAEDSEPTGDNVVGFNDPK